ncbi:Uncharacterised protein [Mycobacterium tuberculosis]|nr:Uncharacterised protein [Mycobacterium tuberculosis]CKW00767.1 Uncharacterised protein [Mycobacterium tuberculosis]
MTFSNVTIPIMFESFFINQAFFLQLTDKFDTFFIVIVICCEINFAIISYY